MRQHLTGPDRTVDLNAPSAFERTAVGQIRTVAVANATRPIVPVNGGVRNINVITNLGVADYNGLQTLISYRGNRRFNASLSYTLSKATNTTEVDGNGNGIGRNQNILSALGEVERGPSVVDQRHRAVLSFLYNFPYGFTAGTVSQFASARPFNATTGVDNHGDGAANDRPFIDGRVIGKSAFIKLLARLIRPKTGVVEYQGTDVSRSSDAELAKIRAVLSQAIEVAFPLTVREIVMMGRYPHFGSRPRRVDEQIVDEIMEFFEITEFSTRNYQTLSGGERQRVNFARVLGQLWRPAEDGGCRYLFLDEPLTFVDIHHQIAFMKKIRDFTKGDNVVTIGVVHDLNLAARFADQILLLDQGRIVAKGVPNDVLTGERISNVFGVEPIMVPVEN